MKNQNNPHWDDPKPNFKWPITVLRPIQAPAAKVWDVISMPGNLEFCHPFCAKNPVFTWPGEQSQDEIHYLSGWVMQRNFCRWIEGIGYDLEIGMPDRPKSFVSWRIKSLDNQNCILRIAVYPHILQNIPAFIRWLPHVLYLGPHLKKYLSSVTRGFEWYLVRGEPVPLNQFGSHSWFSGSKFSR